MDERIEEILRDHLSLSRWLLELRSPPATDAQVYEALRDYLCVMKRLREIEEGPWPDATERKVLCQYLETARNILKLKCEDFGLTPLDLVGFGLDMREDDDPTDIDDGGSGVLAPTVTGPRRRPGSDAKPMKEVHEEGEDERR